MSRKFYGENDPRSLLDGPSGDDDYEAPRQRFQKRTRSPRSGPVVSQQPRASQQQPGEVSDRVWGLAEQFIEEGKAFFGRNIPVNRAEFSKRLSEVIKNDPDVKKILGPREWNAEHTRLVAVRLTEDDLDKRLTWINDVVAEMITLFWRDLEVGASLNGGLQFRFLHDDWDDLWYRAVTNLKVKSLTKGLADGTVFKREANYRMVPEESQEAHRLKRLQIRLRREGKGEDRDPITDEQREGFAAWVADRKRSRDNVAN